jgi:hypothetical protein
MRTGVLRIKIRARNPSKCANEENENTSRVERFGNVSVVRSAFERKAILTTLTNVGDVWVCTFETCRGIRLESRYAKHSGRQSTPMNL